jgi:RimJ/RimL family protein N-acetyltransferase/8-oxo-dGTP pyrophosphatase MutT (NUDIX family)
MCVGALIRDGRHRVFAHRRSPTRRLFPGIWDIVGGHVEPGEQPPQALAREIEEETGWRLRRIEAVVADWEWEYDGVTRHELDYLVEVDGDLDAPRLEEGKQDAYAWVGRGELDLMMAGRTDGDRRLRDIVAKGTRIRYTDRTRLEPVGPEHAGDLWRLHQESAVAHRHGGPRRREHARDAAVQMGQSWESDGVPAWVGYHRGGRDLVGRGGLSYVELDGRRRLEVGWAVLPYRWGGGYATEIGQAGLDFARDELGTGDVVAFTEPHNARSRAVLERLGLRYARDITRGGERFVLYETVHRAPGLPGSGTR